MLALQHDGLRHIRQFVENYLDLLGIDVLSVLGENHVLAAAQQEYVAVLIDGADVAGTEPAVLQYLGRGLGILVIALEDDVALDGQLAGDVLRIRRIDADLHDLGQVFAAGLRDVFAHLAVGHDRGELGQAVARDERDLELVNKQGLDFGRNGGTAGGEHFDVAAHGGHQLVVQHLAVIRIILIISQFRLSFRAVDLGAEHVFGEFHEDERHAVEDARAHLHQGLLDVFRDWRQAEHGHVHAHGHRNDHVAGQAEAVRVRQQAQVVLALVEREARTDALHVGRVVAVGQHHALRIAGGTGGIEDGADLVEVGMDDLEISGLHTGRVTLREQLRAGGVDFPRSATARKHFAGGGIDGAEDLGHLLEIHRVEGPLLRVQDAAVGMVDQPLRVGRSERVIEMDGHVTLADRRHEDGGTEGAALGVDGYFVAGLQAGFLPDQVQGFDPLRKFAVGDGGLAEIAQRGTVPAVADSAFEEADEVVDFDHFSVVFKNRLRRYPEKNASGNGSTDFVVNSAGQVGKSRQRGRNDGAKLLSPARTDK